jgi:hypothetical protein
MKGKSMAKTLTRMSKTVKGAIIAGIFLIIATLITGFFSLTAVYTPIHATQTAEQKYTSNSLISTSEKWTKNYSILLTPLPEIITPTISPKKIEVNTYTPTQIMNCVAPKIYFLSLKPEILDNKPIISVVAISEMNKCFSEMHLKVDGVIVAQSFEPEYIKRLDGRNYNDGDHIVRLEVKAVDDDFWYFPSIKSIGFHKSGSTISIYEVECEPPALLSMEPDYHMGDEYSIVIIRAKASSDCFGSMRIKIDNELKYTSVIPELIFEWRAIDYGIGDHIITIEINAKWDTNWINPNSHNFWYSTVIGW